MAITDVVVTEDISFPASANAAPAVLNSPAVDATEIIDSLGFEVTPELREQFRTWKDAKLAEVLNYLHTNWDLTEVTLDRLVMMPQFVFPDRKNRNLYGQVAPGAAFTNADGEVVPHPKTGEPILFTVWRRVDPPAPVEAVDETPEPEDKTVATNPAVSEE